MPTYKIEVQSYTSYDIQNHYTSVYYHNSSPKRYKILPKIQNAHVWMEIREPKGSAGQGRSRAGQPALLDKPSPQWKAPLRSRPPNLNMQIQRVKT